MRWDPTGERLVVSFASPRSAGSSDETDDVNEDSGLLCVFSTKVSSSNIVITPLGFIRGEYGETPSTFEFARHFKGGALLTIVSIVKISDLIELPLILFWGSNTSSRIYL